MHLVHLQLADRASELVVVDDDARNAAFFLAEKREMPTTEDRDEVWSAKYSGQPNIISAK